MSSDMSIKMIQSRARCRLDCSLPFYCVKLLTATLQTVWVTRQESKAYLCVIYATRHSYSDRHFERSLNFPQIDLSFELCLLALLPLQTILLTDQFVPNVTQKRLSLITLANSLNPDQTQPNVCSCLVMVLKLSLY